MKKINLIIALIAMTLIVSCKSDDTTNNVVIDASSEMEGTIAFTRTLAEKSETIDFTYTIPQSFGVESTLTVKGVVAGVTLVRGTVTVPAGSTTGMGSIDMPADDISYGVNKIVLSIEGLALTSTDDNPISDTYRVSSNEVTLDLYDNIPSLHPSRLSVQLDWEGYAGSDLDLVSLRSDGSGWDGAASGSRYEEGTLIWDADPDDTYILSIDPYSTPAANPFKYTFILRLSDDTFQVLSGEFDAANLGNYTSDVFTSWPWTPTVYRIMEIEKVGSAYTATIL